MNIAGTLLKWISKLFKKSPAVMPLTGTPISCGINKYYVYQCENPAKWLLFIKNQKGYCERCFVCDSHHPEKFFWLLRHFELKGMGIELIQAVT